MQLFGSAHKLVAIHLWHMDIAEEKVEGAGERLLDHLKGVMSREGRDDSVAARFQQEGADREYLFVVVYAEDGLLGPQSSLTSAGGRRPMGQVTRRGWFAAPRTRVFRCAPARPAGDVLRRVVGLPLPVGDGQKRRGSPVCLLGNRATFRRTRPDRGVREMLAQAQVASRRPERTQAINLP